MFLVPKNEVIMHGAVIGCSVRSITDSGLDVNFPFFHVTRGYFARETRICYQKNDLRPASCRTCHNTCMTHVTKKEKSI